MDVIFFEGGNGNEFVSVKEGIKEDVFIVYIKVWDNDFG